MNIDTNNETSKDISKDISKETSKDISKDTPKETSKLNLNFHLLNAEERLAHVNETVDLSSLSKEDLEKVSNYLLYPLNIKPLPESTLESLDALTEDPNFAEFRITTYAPLPPKKRTVFSRAEALSATANNPELNQIFIQLFREIDILELQTTLYDYIHEKRAKPPRTELTQLFTTPELINAFNFADTLSIRAATKLKKKLVSLRQQQYALKDLYSPSLIQKHNLYFIQNPIPLPSFDCEISVAPAGLYYPASADIFIPINDINPALYTKARLTEIKSLLNAPRSKLYFDFTNPEHIAHLLYNYHYLKQEAAAQGADSTLKDLLRTLNYYINQANLDPAQKDCMKLKMRHLTNEEIRHKLNKKYGTSYRENYISTIFHLRVAGKIADAAQFHEAALKGLITPGSYKKCRGCGRLLLRDPHVFTRRQRAVDGYNSKCRACT